MKPILQSSSCTLYNYSGKSVFFFFSSFCFNGRHTLFACVGMITYLKEGNPSLLVAYQIFIWYRLLRRVTVTGTTHIILQRVLNRDNSFKIFHSVSLTHTKKKKILEMWPFVLFMMCGNKYIVWGLYLFYTFLLLYISEGFTLTAHAHLLLLLSPKLLLQLYSVPQGHQYTWVHVLLTLWCCAYTQKSHFQTIYICSYKLAIMSVQLRGKPWCWYPI